MSKSLVYHKQIPGYLSDKESRELFRVALLLPPNSLVVEIGSWLGKSSFILAKAIENKNGKLYCIDPFDGSGDPQSIVSYQKNINKLKINNLKDEFIKNMRVGEVLDIITVLEGRSDDFVQKFNQNINLLFIDGDHRLKYIERDWNNWSIKVKKGGFVIFDDVYYQKPVIHKAPKQVIEKYILPDKNWMKVSLVDALFTAQKIN